MHTRCLDCREWATHKGRCVTCHRAYESTRSAQSHSKRRAAIAAGNRAAARLRAAVRRAGEATCARCTGIFLPSGVDIDHIRPLSQGGTDTDGNVQVLCRVCHRVKTNSDMSYRSPRF